MSGGEECGSSVENAAGGWGRWQARLALLLALPVMLTGLYGTNYVFLAAHTPHRYLPILIFYSLLRYIYLKSRFICVVAP